MTHTTRLFVIGDSISIDYGPYLEKFLPAWMSYDRKRDSGDALADENADPRASANGGHSRRVLAYLAARRANVPIETDVLLLNCGLHDIKTNAETGEVRVSAEEYEANLCAILEESRLAGWRLLWVRTTPVIDELHNFPGKQILRFAADAAAYNAIADRVMDAARIEKIDLEAFTRKLLPQGLRDHVHYTEEVSALQAAYLAGAIGSLLADVN